MDFFFVARQPIFDLNKNIVAYELLFRDSPENYFPEICPNEATSKIIEGGFIGSTLVDTLMKTTAFINFTFENIVKNHAHFLDPKKVVIEILETSKPGKKLLAACISLKEQGYTLALDDYIDHEGWLDFFPYIDIIKVDLSQMKSKEFQALREKAAHHKHLQFLAERVETLAEFEKCKLEGFSLFQGYFFARPEILKGKTLPPSTVCILDLMQKLLRKDIPFQEVAKVVEKDVPMTVRLLNYANSAKFKRETEIDTVKKAVVSLGYTELYKVASLLFITQASSSKPTELIKTSLIRARFCELLSSRTHPGQQDVAFLTGLLSLLDTMLDMQMHEITATLPLSSEVMSALNNAEGTLGLYLSAVKAYERGFWDEFSVIATKLGIVHNDAAHHYLEAVRWSDEQF